LLIKGENIMTAITTYRPSLLGRNVFEDVFGGILNELPAMLKQTTQGYPVTDIYQNDSGDTVLEFALAGFSRENLSVEVKPENRSITVRANSGADNDDVSNRRIARRSFEKTYVNYDDNLDLSAVSAEYENGLLCIVVPKRPAAQPLKIEIS